MDYSIVQYESKDSSSCGYCGSSNASISHGLWAHSLTVSDYQMLIDRGWRRCGLYCYKPVMNETCCPAYTIRCDALDFVLTKSQKKVLRKMTAFLKKTVDTPCDTNVQDSSHIVERAIYERKIVLRTPKPLSLEEKKMTALYRQPSASTQQNSANCNEQKMIGTTGEQSNVGLGDDCRKPKCKKAKLIRLENRKRKLLQKSTLTTFPDKVPKGKEKILEDYIDENEKTSPKKLVVTLVPSCHDNLEECWILYKKYQIAVHNDNESNCSYSSFSHFLVSSPLQPHKDESSPAMGYGSFHQLYRLDEKLVAVGIIDILPTCVSSVYFFYDPDLSNLSLGTYGSLRELGLTRSLATKTSQLNRYYLGFYIHSCPKMKYKSRFLPSFLLCPEAYTWHSISSSVGKIEASKYSRLNEDAVAKNEDSEDINEVLILSEKSIIPFGIFRERNRLTSDDDELAKEYVHLVGGRLAKKLFLRWQL